MTAAEFYAKFRTEVAKVLVGQDEAVRLCGLALAVGGHVLLEGVPGVGKTLLAKTIATALDLDFRRVQFTPDLLPADIVGTSIYDLQAREFRTRQGPVFTNILLADEINRAPAKVQSALLEAMEERGVTLEGHQLPLPAPFLVLATQNPIEADGTYPLPEAQIDRFMLKVLVGYPSFAEEVVVVDRMVGPAIEIEQVIDIDELLEMQRVVRETYVDPAVINYAATLATATRNPAHTGLPEFTAAIAYGASPRASIHLVSAARALAFIRGRGHVLAHDVADVAPEVLRHRLVLSYEGIADGVSPEAIVSTLLERYPPPRLDLGDRHAS